MKQSEAIEFLSVPGKSNSMGEVWSDFGCGSGTFTLALSHLIHPTGRIIAVDKDRHSLQQIPNHFNQVVIEKKHADFVTEEFPFHSFDGILMANSLHYVQNQAAFIARAKKFLKPKGCLLMVEYETNTSNPWIPYPVSFNHLRELFMAAGYSSIKKIMEKSSRYNSANLYSAIIKQ